MPDNPRNRPPAPPKSPDQLEPAIHGKVLGVSRIGRRAIGAVALIGAVILSLIIYGAQGPQKKKTSDFTYAPQPMSHDAHFGDDEPLGMYTPSPTPLPSPLLALLATPSPKPTPTMPPTESPAQIEAEREARERAEARAAAEAKARALANSALTAPLMLAAANTGSDVGGASAHSATTPSPESSESPGPKSSPTKDPNAFLNGPVGQFSDGGAERKVSGDRVPPTTPYEVVAGSILPAVLISAIDTQNPGFITGQVREDVYDSLTGKYLLIPRGSRLIGVYQSVVQVGQTRVLVAWKRLIFPDTASIDLANMSGSDTQGTAGFAGHTDTHFGELFGQALLASVITAGLQLSQPQQSVSSSGGAATTTVAPGAIAAGAIGQSVAQTLGSEIQQKAAIPPTITIPKGYPFDIIVDRDLVLTEPYGGLP